MVSRRSPAEIVFDLLNTILLVFAVIVTLYPLLYVAFASVSDATEMMKFRGVLLAPLGFDLQAYQRVLTNPMVGYGYRNTLFIVIVGTTLNVLMTTLAAYALSRRRLYFKNLVVFLITFTMFFSGGLIPTYVVVQRLGLTNTYWSVILLLALDTFYLIVTKTYFQSIPESLEESAKIDGANDLVILRRIFLPLSKPVLATFLLFYAVDRWNEWFYAMLFIKKSTLLPLQVIIRNMVFVTIYEIRDSALDSVNVFFGEGIKMAAIILTMLPIMLFYPFLQKHFVKGVLVGAIKS